MSRVRGKLACTVLRGADCRKVVRLPDVSVGAQVRQGEKAAHVVFYREFDVEKTADDDDGKRRVLRTSSVFNAAQVDGAP